MTARMEHRVNAMRRWGYAAAAGMLLMFSISLIVVTSTIGKPNGSELAQSVLRHIAAESHHLSNQHPVASQQLTALFDRFGAQLSAGVGQINFAAECLMRTRSGIHLIAPGRVGPISAFLMPGQPTERAQAIKTDTLAGTITPTAWGNLAVVGEPGEEISRFSERLIAATQWPATQLSR